ncbi:MAG: bifunctional homocysteine S-methyltransferase/methylenetetrahydrofolate reductase, partial [Planctomycetota bacterium]
MQRNFVHTKRFIQVRRKNLSRTETEKRTNFLQRLEKDIIIFDGGMGTSIYTKGIYINRCFDHLNLTDSDMILEIHREYIEAGAEAIETNTFGANRIQLGEFNLADKVYEINYEGAKIAREAGGEHIFVAGAIGPLGIKIEPWGEMSVEEAREIFREQVEALYKGGVDCFILETFSDLNEIHQAILAVKEVCSLPIIAQMTIDRDGSSLYGTPPEVYTKRLDEWGADVIGLNCSVGPASMLDTIEKMMKLTSKKLSAQPNAGMPRNVKGRNFYLCSPEYMGKYAKYFIQRGVRIVGGCCGTTPEMIQAIANAVRAYSPTRPRAQVLSPSQSMMDSVEVKPVPQEDKSNFARKISQKEFVTSVELNPPKGFGLERTLKRAKLLKEGGVDAINIPDGPRATARMSPMAMAVRIEQEVGMETVLHYCCRDRNLLGMQSDLLGAAALGLRNILVITGDPPKLGDYPNA